MLAYKNETKTESKRLRASAKQESLFQTKKKRNFHFECLNSAKLAINLFDFLIQVAQVPDRHEPSTPGEVNFKFVFKKLEDVGYNGWIGCEYKPSGDSKDNLEWINDYGYSF